MPNDDDGYCLLRSFGSLAELRAQEADFYGAAPWRDGPREALVSWRDTSGDMLLRLGPAAIADLRARNVPPPMGA